MHAIERVFGARGMHIVEAVLRTAQFEKYRRTARGAPQALAEDARIADRNDAVDCAMHDHERWRILMDLRHRRRQVPQRGIFLGCLVQHAIAQKIDHHLLIGMLLVAGQHIV